jgi:hypothetical protein
MCTSEIIKKGPWVLHITAWALSCTNKIPRRIMPIGMPGWNWCYFRPLLVCHLEQILRFRMSRLVMDSYETYNTFECMTLGGMLIGQIITLCQSVYVLQKWCRVASTSAPTVL